MSSNKSSDKPPAPTTNEEWGQRALAWCKQTISAIIYMRTLDQDQMYLAATLLDRCGQLPELPTIDLYRELP